MRSCFSKRHFISSHFPTIAIIASSLRYPQHALSSLDFLPVSIYFLAHYFPEKLDLSLVRLDPKPGQGFLLVQKASR